MKKLTKIDEEKIWEEVKKEFPHDEMMQMIHFVRLKHYYQMKELTVREQIEFYNNPH